MRVAGAARLGGGEFGGHRARSSFSLIRRARGVFSIIAKVAAIALGLNDIAVNIAKLPELIGEGQFGEPIEWSSFCPIEGRG